MAEAEKVMLDREAVALKRFQELIDWYESKKSKNRILYFAFTTMVITLSGITPIVILLTEEKSLQAIPPAIAAILGGLSGVYRFHEQWLRFGLATEALKSELIKYQTRSGDEYDSDLPKAEALENFVLKMESIVSQETVHWSQQRKKQKAPEKNIS